MEETVFVRSVSVCVCAQRTGLSNQYWDNIIEMRNDTLLT